MTALMIVLGISLFMFLASLVTGLVQGADTRRYCQYLIAQTLHGDDHAQMNASFGKAARRPARILGTFIF